MAVTIEQPDGSVKHYGPTKVEPLSAEEKNHLEALRRFLKDIQKEKKDLEEMGLDGFRKIHGKDSKRLYWNQITQLEDKILELEGRILEYESRVMAPKEISVHMSAEDYEKRYKKE